MNLIKLHRRAPSARVEAVGFVRNRLFASDKVSQGAMSRSGKANIPASTNEEDVVHGVVFSIGADEVAALDEAEKGYRNEKNIAVVTAAGGITAFAYTAIETDATACRSTGTRSSWSGEPSNTACPPNT
jgi:gamma-glutamylcyclotransferase (GGCT)/AIG2-like uncharacterized protein YtfP